MARWREADGQATSEYAALVALVAVVLALAAGLTAGGVAGELLAGLQRGLCRVAGAACARPRPAHDGLAPCPLERTTSGESLHGAFELVRLGGGGTLTAVRTSDGRVTVTLADDATLGGEIGFGYSIAAGRRHGAAATAGIETRVASGRSWTLPDAAAARAFVERYGSKATVGGTAVDFVRSGCSLLCDAIGWRPHAELPPPDEQYLDRSTTGRPAALLGPVSAHASDGRTIGLRLRRDGGVTWFMQLDATLGARLDLGLGMGALEAGQKTVVSYALDARHRPVELGLHRVVTDRAGGAGRAGRGRATAGLGAGAAGVTELDATLDLHDARNRAAAAAFVATLRSRLDPPRLRERAAAVGRRIAATGVVDRRTYAVSSSALALGAALTLGGQLGGGFERTHERMRLLSAETRLPGLPFLPRDDCRPS
jgi:Flp pilus assembly pilin Flp